MKHLYLFPLSLGAVLFLGACTMTKDTVEYSVDPDWPQKPGEIQWGQMPGIAVDAKDRVYIYTRNQPSIQVYQTDGKFLRAINTQGSQGAHHIKIAPDGNIWAADNQSHVVQKYSPEGKLLLTLGETGRAGKDQQHFNEPTDMTILPSGELFVSDGYGNRRIVHFDATGKYVKEWGEEGIRPGQFRLPHSIVADSKGRLYVADRENARIQVFDQSGKVLAVWENLVTPWSLFMTKNNELWVCGSTPVRKEEAWVITPPPDQLVMKLSLQGELLFVVPFERITKAPGNPGELDWVHGIALDSQGNIYVGDVRGNRAQKFAIKK